MVSRTASTSTYASASRCVTAWNEPIGRPNATRLFAYSAVSSSARSITPDCTAHRPTVARVTSQSATPAPGPCPASTRSSSSEHPSSTTRPAVLKSVSRCGSTRTPASDGATRNTRTPSGVAHGTRNRSASGAASTAVFTPDSTHRPPARSARADGRRGSSPSGSARAAVSSTEPRPAAAAHRSR